MTTVQSQVEDSVSTAKLWVGRTLRDHPELRYVSRRRDLIKKVQEVSGQDIYAETITRVARWFQNTKGMYAVDDDRYQRESSYRKLFGGKHENNNEEEQHVLHT